MPTILELFKGSEKDTSVKADKETLIEQETTGIRFRSAVDINNPLIYGNEAIRITQRSTPLLEDMKAGTGGESNGGLIGGKIAKARDFVNSTLGIPETQTPTRLIENENIQIQNLNPPKANPFPGIDIPTPPKKVPKSFEDVPSNIPITKDIISKNGTGFGKFLQQSGGGNPKTIGKQALGNGIGLAKDKLRGALFGEQTVGSNDVEPQIATTTNERTYSDVNKSKRLPSEEGVQKDLEGTKLDLSLVSPIYGVTRAGSVKFGTPEGQFGKTEYAFQDKGFRDSEGNYTGEGVGFRLNKFAPQKGQRKSDSLLPNSSLTDKYGITTKNGDTINKLTTLDYDTIDDLGRYKKGETVVGQDLIPFYIGKLGEKKTPFRSILTGITETVSPSWNSQKFLGNPFPFYTYSQVERSTSFNLKIVAYNSSELNINWEKIERLTKMVYPKINQNKLVNPPIIDFRLGDIYFNKIGFIENLTYTIPDNGVWETDGSSGFLPKFIEVAITIKFIEDSSVIHSLYGLKKSKPAVEKIKEETKGIAFSEESQTGITPSGDVPNKKSNKVTVTSRGTTPVGDDGNAVTGVPSKKSNNVKSIEPKGIAKTSTPIESEMGDIADIVPTSAQSDNLGGKTPLQFENEQGTQNLGKYQTSVLGQIKADYPDAKIVSLNSIPGSVRASFRWEAVTQKLYFDKSVIIKFSKSDGNDYYAMVWEDPNYATAPYTEPQTSIFDEPVDASKITKSDTLFGL
jgi:hypothetical protein